VFCHNWTDVQNWHQNVCCISGISTKYGPTIPGALTAKNTPAITLSNVALWINEQGKSVILTDHITTHDMTPSSLQNRMSMQFIAPACTLQHSVLCHYLCHCICYPQFSYSDVHAAVVLNVTLLHKCPSFFAQDWPVTCFKMSLI